MGKYILEKIWYKTVNKKEMDLIIKYESNNPSIGYNRIPKYKTK